MCWFFETIVNVCFWCDVLSNASGIWVSVKGAIISESQLCVTEEVHLEGT